MNTQRIKSAIENIKSIAADYWASTLAQRSEVTGAGSTYDRSPEEIEAAILNSTWEEYAHEAVAPGCIAFISYDMPKGRLGIIDLIDLKEDKFVILDDRKSTGTVSAVIPGIKSQNFPGFTVLILGMEKNAEGIATEVVFTFHPGNPVAPSTIKTDAGLHNKAVTIAQAKAMGLTTAKIVREALCNCTPHDIMLEANGKRTVFPPSGIIPRLVVTEIPGDEVAGFETVATQYGDVEGLPPKQPGLTYIVSSMVLANCSRPDVVAPDTGKTAIRKDGKIEAVTRFTRCLAG
jgi:hypothetical protein